VAGFCRHGNERTTSVIAGECLEQLEMGAYRKIYLYFGGAPLNFGREIDYPEYFHDFPQTF
jgi:hypothetical protein